MNTSRECLRGAFAALLKGDIAERDRLCDRAATLLEAESKMDAVAKVLAVDFYVTRLGVAVPTERMARMVGVIQ